MTPMKQDPLECCLTARLLLTALLLVFCVPLLFAGAWAPFALCAAMVVGAVFFSGRLEYRRLARAEQAFLAHRTALSDDDFLRYMDAEPELASFYLAGRRAMADLDGIPADMVRPNDTVQSLLDLQFDNGFLEDFVFALEDQLQTPVPLSFPVNAHALSFGAFLKELARYRGHAGKQ